MNKINAINLIILLVHTLLLPTVYADQDSAQKRADSSEVQQNGATAFKYNFPAGVSNFPLQQPNSIKATDGAALAYYAFVPKKPEKALIFYHGGGAWSGKLYQYFATQLQQRDNIAVYLFDIRGHGHSEGPRGDAPCAEQVWQDITTAIDFVHQNHPSLPITLGGHSSGAGLVLNYNRWHRHPAVHDYLFLAPFLGPRANTHYEYANIEKRFIKKVRLIPLLIYAILGKRWFVHTPVIYFNYPQTMREQDPFLLTSYTNAMADAVTPDDPVKAIQALQYPYTVCIGTDDEQFDPQKTTAFFRNNTAKEVEATINIVPEVTHFSLLYELAKQEKS